MDIETILRPYMERDFSEAVARMQELIRIPSVNAYNEGGYPFGTGVHDSLEYCLNLGREMGFKAVNMDDMCGYIEYGEGEEMVAAVAHLDVIPVGDGWTKEPFGAVIKDNKMYGRGTLDDKGPALSAIYALKAIRDAGIKLSRRIRVIFGTNEEIACKGIVYYCEHGGEIPKYGFSPDAGYPVLNAEKGGAEFTFSRPYARGEGFEILEFTARPNEGVVPPYAMIRFKTTEQAVRAAMQLSVDKVTFTCGNGEIKAEAKGILAHIGIANQGENAISRLFLALKELPLTGDMKNLTDFITEKFNMDISGKGLGVAWSDEASGSVMVILGGLDVLEQEIRIHFNIRTPVLLGNDAFLAPVRAAMAEGGFTEVSHTFQNGMYMPYDCYLVQTLNGIYHDFTGLPVFPRYTSGGTYARFMPNIVAFGPNFPGEPPIIHLPDEYMDLDKMKKNILINAVALAKLAE